MSTKNKVSMSDKSIEFLEQLTQKKMTIGNLLWSIRECEEMSQAVFSKLLGVSRQYLCDIEHNRRIVSPKTAVDFAIKLGHSPIQFVRLAVQDEFDKYGLNYDIQIVDQSLSQEHR